MISFPGIAVGYCFPFPFYFVFNFAFGAPCGLLDVSRCCVRCVRPPLMVFWTPGWVFVKNSSWPFSADHWQTLHALETVGHSLGVEQPDLHKDACLVPVDMFRIQLSALQAHDADQNDLNPFVGWGHAGKNPRHLLGMI